MILILTLSSNFYYNFKLSHQVHVYSVDYQISLFFLFLGINFSNQHAYVVIYQLFDYIFEYFYVLSLSV